MGDDVALTRPGKPDINAQFTAGRNIRKSRGIYDRIKNHNTGHYNFGELTADFYRFNNVQKKAWLDDIANNYRQDVIAKIRDHVEKVLDKVDLSKPPTSISLRFEWAKGIPDAKLTVTGNAYTITIYGQMEPSIMPFVKRQKT